MKSPCRDCPHYNDICRDTCEQLAKFKDQLSNVTPDYTTTTLETSYSIGEGWKK